MGAKPTNGRLTEGPERSGVAEMRIKHFSPGPKGLPKIVQYYTGWLFELGNSLIRMFVTITNIVTQLNVMFSSTKSGHFAHIMVTALVGQMASQGLVPPDPDKIESYGHLIIQALVALVTIWATVRKALQRPEAVVKLPAEGVVAAAEAAAATESVAPVAGKSSNGND